MPDVAIPVNSAELTELLMDKKSMDIVYQDPAKFGEFLTNYVKASNKADVDISKQVDELVQKGLADFAKHNKVDLKRPDMRPASVQDVKMQRATGAAYSNQAPGSALDGDYGTLYEFFDTIGKHRDPREPEVAEKRKKIQNAMSSTDPGSGGFLIPEQFRTELLRVAMESAIVRPRSRVIPMASLRVAMPTIDITSNVANVFGGVVGYWTEEGAALVESQPSFSRVQLEAKKLTAYTEFQNELRQDSAVTIEALLNEIYPEAITWFEDIAFLQGSGAGEPLGVFNAANANIVVQAKESGQGTSTILWENLVGMFSRMLPASLGKAVWIASIDTFPQLATMALSVGTGGSAIWLNNGVEGPPVTILGRPVIFTEKTSVLGAQGDISFVDFSQYLIGDRMAMSAEMSEDYRFGNDLAAYRIIERVDGRPWMAQAVTPRNGGPTLSPTVQLAARP